MDCSGGVPGADWGMGGKDSRSAAPKDDDGLKGFKALKPVVCGWRAVGDEIEVAPVG